jgi:hypothetical protein
MCHYRQLTQQETFPGNAKFQNSSASGLCTFFSSRCLVLDTASNVARLIHCPRWQAPALLSCVDLLLMEQGLCPQLEQKVGRGNRTPGLSERSKLLAEVIFEGFLKG